MQEETQLLVNAIESLKQEPNVLKDYLFPIFLSFFAALFGSLTGYFTIKHQEKIQLEKNKMDATNKWLLKAKDAFDSLIAIKRNYHGELEDNPYQRTAKIPTILHYSKPIEEDLSDLNFIIPKQQDKKAQKIKWRQISRIKAMIDNYNLVIQHWNIRNQLERPIKEKILRQTNQTHIFLNQKELLRSVHPSEVASLIDFTERTIKLTDDLIIELHDFLSEFPTVAKGFIHENKIKRYGSVQIMTIPPKAAEMLEKTVEVNYEMLSELLNEQPEKIKNSYATGYES